MAEPLIVVDSFGRSQQADSEPEYLFAQALLAEGKRFWFQYSVRGGHGLKGGIILDFLVYDPFRIGIEIIGGYWHRETSEERFRDAIVEQFLGRELIKRPDTEIDTYDKARRAVKRYL